MAFIITGHQRSDTTLLRKLCERHPDISMTDISMTREFGNFLRLNASYSAYIRRMLVRWGCILTRGQRCLATCVVRQAGWQTVLHNHLFVGRYLAEMQRRPECVDVPAVEAASRSLVPRHGRNEMARGPSAGHWLRGSNSGAGAYASAVRPVARGRSDGFDAGIIQGGSIGKHESRLTAE